MLPADNCRLLIADCQSGFYALLKSAIGNWQSAMLFPLLILLLAQTVSAQCTKKVTELPAAPELLGFRLGMAREQIKVQVPQAVFGRTDPFGVSKTTINPYFDPRIDKAKFEGVRSISLDLLDERLTSVWIGFDETFKAQTVEDFVKLISQSLQVPANWSSWRTRGRQLRCADFELTVTTVAGAPSFRILDTSAEEVVAQRRQAKEERDAIAEATATTTKDTESEQLIGDKQSRTYYPNGCRPTKEIAAGNKITFKTAAEAEKTGFKLAKNCR